MVNKKCGSGKANGPSYSAFRESPNLTAGDEYGCQAPSGSCAQIPSPLCFTSDTGRVVINIDYTTNTGTMTYADGHSYPLTVQSNNVVVGPNEYYSFDGKTCNTSSGCHAGCIYGSNGETFCTC
jgi:hypothetical protein